MAQTILENQATVDDIFREVTRIKAVVTDAVDDGVQSALRAMKQGREAAKTPSTTRAMPSSGTLCSQRASCLASAFSWAASPLSWLCAAIESGARRLASATSIGAVGLNQSERRFWGVWVVKLDETCRNLSTVLRSCR